MADKYTSFPSNVTRDCQKKAKYPQGTLNLYLSSYVLFFNDETDDCDTWTFGHSVLNSRRPKLVKG
ncbi:hypothetical protein IMZ48_49500 [Candidatus Bathyarchaeota archaeon]|nr:hypothetical protein [Candidatus Bathyarchaeota archaeon]